MAAPRMTKRAEKVLANLNLLILRLPDQKIIPEC
jgi:hypothetical protein